MTLSIRLIPLALLTVTTGLLAAQPPGAGSQLQQIPPTPTLPKELPDVRIAPAAAPAPALADSTRIPVRSLLFTGAQLYPDAALTAIAGFQPGSELTLGELRAMAGKITEAYHRDGYVLAQAYLPAQEIRNGVVTIAAAEGRYGKIQVRNQTNFSNALVDSVLDGVNAGDVVAIAPLESRLLLLSDIPGVGIRSTLAPGASAGTSDLIVDIVPGPRVSGSIDADNAGNRYTGEYRIGATVNLNDPLGQGDLASLRVLTSGAGLNYARASYHVQLGKAKVGVTYSRLEYALGREFDPLDANGIATVASVYSNYPLIRSRSTNLYAQLGVDHKTFKDRIDSTGARSDKRADVLMTSLYGEHRDQVGGGGISSASMTLAIGRLDIQSPDVASFDAANARTAGRYSRLSASVSRLQALTENASLYAGVSGQVASKNLDISEKMALGGIGGVRAYPEGEAFADQGYLLNLEARYRVPARYWPSYPGQLQLIAFVDTGTVSANKSPWTAGTNRRTLSGAGVGVNLIGDSSYSVKAYYAHKLGGEEALSAPDRSGRFWIQGVKYF